MQRGRLGFLGGGFRGFLSGGVGAGFADEGLFTEHMGQKEHVMAEALVVKEHLSCIRNTSASSWEPSKGQ